MLHPPVNGGAPPANERSEWYTDLTYTHLQGAGGWALAMALHALVRQTTRAKPKLALQWWRDARRAYPRFSPQSSSRWTKVDSLDSPPASRQPV
jgi:hypothetical protein